MILLKRQTRDKKIMVNCVSCNKELSGGLDTFGPHYAQMCKDCYLSGRGEVDLDEESNMQKEIEVLQEELEDLYPQLRDLDYEIGQLEKQLKVLKEDREPLLKRQKEIRDRLEGWGIGA